MTATRVRWGIIGPGRIAHSFARDIGHTRSAELVAVATRAGRKTLGLDFEAEAVSRGRFQNEGKK